jgi:aspartokinase-like uncharacterized kinase
MRRSDVTVVKLGGSQSASTHLRGWLNALAQCGGRAVVVPGGGPFADAVRMAQLKMGLGDPVAHHMALLAMEQYGRALASLAPGIHVAGTIAEIRSALRARQVPVWAPAQMALKAADIPANWHVTSDSLAAWLAGRLGAGRLLLVKLGGPYEGRLRVQKLAAAGVVDQAFPYFLAQSEAQGRIVAATDHAAADAIRDGSEIGARIDLHERDGRRLTPRRWPRSRHRAGAGR